MNNVTYYSYFDTAANALLIQKTGFDIHEAKSIGLVVDSACSFFQELSFPEVIQVGVAIGKLVPHLYAMNWQSLNKVKTKHQLKDILCMCLLIVKHARLFQYPSQSVKF